MTITAVIPLHNRAHCITRAVGSVLAQTKPVDEILIVDDGSTDDLDSALKPFAHAVRVIRHTTNQGASAARNSGIREARGEYVAFLDSDDAWKPGKLRQQTAFMARSSLNISCTNFELVRPGGSAPRVADRPYPERIGRDEFLWGCYTCPGSTLIIKRSVLLEHRGYDTSFPRYEDWDLLLRLTFSGRHHVGFLNAPLVTVYLGAPPNVEGAAAGLERMLDRHFENLKAVDPGLARRLLSAVEFSRASLYAREGRYLQTGRKLFRSLFLWPLGNQAIEMILMSKLRDAILAEIPTRSDMIGRPRDSLSIAGARHRPCPPSRRTREPRKGE